MNCFLNNRRGNMTALPPILASAMTSTFINKFPQITSAVNGKASSVPSPCTICYLVAFAWVLSFICSNYSLLGSSYLHRHFPCLVFISTM